MRAASFVDCHSHVLPSGDDGAETLGEALVLCRAAARHGTRTLFATPHVWPSLPLTRARELQIHRALEQIRPLDELDLRLGFELTPAPALLDEDPARYVLEGTDRVLMEVPFAGSLDGLLALAGHVEEAGLRPVIAHPERTEAIRDDPALADALAERGWALQVNATSLLGLHGEVAHELGWDLLRRGRAALVASDGHRRSRPPHLDGAFALAVERLGADAALPLFDGSALGLGLGSRVSVARTHAA